MIRNNDENAFLGSSEIASYQVLIILAFNLFSDIKVIKMLPYLGCW